MGQCGKQDWSREELPIGTVRIRKHNARTYKRMIKIAPGKWITVARNWWLLNRGPIPEGMRVHHRDGDSLNDDHRNYELLSAGDVAFRAHQRDPEMSRRNYECLRKATALHNRERARVRRILDWLPSYWYPVDFAAREVVNEPQRTRAAVYSAYGVDVQDRVNGAGYVPTVLGYPGLPLNVAVLLAVLSGRWVTLDELRPPLDELYRRHRPGSRAIRAQTLNTATSLAHAKGLIERRRVKTLVSRQYRRIAMPGVTPCPIVAVRGTQLKGLCRGLSTLR